MSAPVPSLTVYAYFRTRPEAIADTRAALAKQQHLVQRELGLLARFSLRQDHDKPYLTWLEVYPGITPEGLAGALEGIEHAAVQSGLSALALQARHHEVFAPLTPE